MTDKTGKGIIDDSTRARKQFPLSNIFDKFFTFIFRCWWSRQRCWEVSSKNLRWGHNLYWI